MSGNQKIVAILMLIISFTGLSVKAQPPASAQQAIEKIYQSYDSIPYISFDVTYEYSSDTIYGDFSHEVLNGTYTMAGKSSLYRLGNIEFMQNDSFFISVYNNDKFILVADPATQNSGSVLPLRSLIDSMMLVYSTHYNISHNYLADTGVITFESIDSFARFKSFSISYDSSHHLLHGINYAFEELEQIDSVQSKMRQKWLTLEFKNYRFDNINEALYDENNYIYFDDRTCRPVDRYRGFKVYNSHTGFLRTDVRVEQAPQ